MAQKINHTRLKAKIRGAEAARAEEYAETRRKQRVKRPPDKPLPGPSAAERIAAIHRSGVCTWTWFGEEWVVTGPRELLETGSVVVKTNSGMRKGKQRVRVGPVMEIKNGRFIARKTGPANRQPPHTLPSTEPRAAAPAAAEENQRGGEQLRDGDGCVHGRPCRRTAGSANRAGCRADTWAEFWGEGRAMLLDAPSRQEPEPCDRKDMSV